MVALVENYVTEEELGREPSQKLLVIDGYSLRVLLSPGVIGGSGTDCLTLVREMSRKQESPPSFIFSKRKGQKHRKIPFRDCFSGSGGRL